MKSDAKTVEEYINSLDPARKETFQRLRNVIAEHIPEGFEERMSYGMPGWVVPLSRFPRGYLDDPAQPLPFLAAAWQKHFLALYHLGLYANQALLERFAGEYAALTGRRPDMGKSCIRFNQPERIPFELIGKMASWISADDWVAEYTRQLDMRR